MNVGVSIECWKLVGVKLARDIYGLSEFLDFTYLPFNPTMVVCYPHTPCYPWRVKALLAQIRTVICFSPITMRFVSISLRLLVYHGVRTMSKIC
jgi:hypothetical protein